MKYIDIKNTDMKVSAVVQGCMRLKGKSVEETESIVANDLENGVNFFDHADVYGTAGMRGECEELFGKALKKNPTWREKMYVQSKCGIKKEGKGYYDFSKEHIFESVDKILGRLQMDYIDTLLLHRPDTLMEPEEVAEAFDLLQEKGKVRYFGVSNMNPLQIELLKKYVKQPLCFNQMQFGLGHTHLVDSGLSVNNKMEQSIDYSESILEYTRLHDMTIQSWSPFQKGFFEGSFIGDDASYKELNVLMEELAKKYNVNKNAIATAWILRHPAKMQVILGTTNLERIKDSCDGSDIEITKAEWYELYMATGRRIL